MCGIAGVLFKRPGDDWPLGRLMLDLLVGLNSRGVDFTGVALYGPASPGRLILRCKLGEPGANLPAEVVVQRAVLLAGLVDYRLEGNLLRLVVEPRGDVVSLVRALEAVAPTVEVFSAAEWTPATPTPSGRGPTPISRWCTTASSPTATGCAATSSAGATSSPPATPPRRSRCTWPIAWSRAPRSRRRCASRCAISTAPITYLVSTPQGSGMAKDRFGIKPLVVTDPSRLVGEAERSTGAFRG